MMLEELQEKLQLATEEQKRGNAKNAEILAQEILTHLDSFSDDINSEENNSEQSIQIHTIRARTMYLLGFCSARLSDYDKSIQYLNSSIIIAEEFNLQEIIAECYNGLGNTYSNLGDKNRSMNYYLQALEIFSQSVVDPHLHRYMAFSN